MILKLGNFIRKSLKKVSFLEKSFETMKHEQVIPDYIVMLESSITVLALVGCGWLLFKLVSWNLLLMRKILKSSTWLYIPFSQACVSLHMVPTVHEEP